jgi:Transposase DNA-binding
MDNTHGTFGQRNFGAAVLGDRRRTKRLVQAVDTMTRHPGGSLPDKLNEPSQLRAFYRLMNCPEVTHTALMHSHAEHTRTQIATRVGQVVLQLHDATELDYTTKTKLLDNLGQIGQGTNRGYICHNSLAVEAGTGAVLGLVSQLLHHRAEVPEGETIKQKRERADRESRLWVQGAKASGPAPAGVRCVDVSDSLSDTFEYLAYEINQGRAFVVRARENRKLEQPLAGSSFLFDGMRALPSVGQRQIEIRDSPTRKGRKTTVQVAFARVQLMPPGKKLGEYENKPLEVWCVRVWEEDTPVGEEPLEWLLLTNVPVENLLDAQERIDWYECRWIIEIYRPDCPSSNGLYPDGRVA